MNRFNKALSIIGGICAVISLIVTSISTVVALSEYSRYGLEALAVPVLLVRIMSDPRLK